MRDLIFGLIGGTALLMYGVDKMGEGLEKASGPMMKRMLSFFTGRVWSAFLVGIVLTVLVQSSTAITVLTVGFVNAGLMKLPNAVGIIYGANIGTTITAQLMAFSFKFKLTEIALPVIGIGFAIGYLAKNKTTKNIGDALMGFGMMFLGLKILNSGIPFMKESEALRFFFQTYAAIPLVGILLGAAATALVHSSSATVALVMVLGQAGLINLETSILIMLGDNIGTCITAQLASLAGNIHARRTAWAHTLYNIFGVFLVALVFSPFVWLIETATAYLAITFGFGSGIEAQIANSHTLFNVISAIVFLPITKYYVIFLEKFIKSRGHDDDYKIHYLDKLLLDNPSSAFRASMAETIRSAEIAKKMLVNTMEGLHGNDSKKLDSVNKDELILNSLQKDITAYIIEISKRSLSDDESVMVPAMVNVINYIERIGDRSEDLVDLIRIAQERNLKFSQGALQGLKDLEDMVMNMYDDAIKAMTDGDIELAMKTIEIEDKVDELSRQLSDAHLERLEKSKCTVDAGVIYLDIVTNFERIGDHVYKMCLNLINGLKGSTKEDKTQA
ncbi:MAG: Na/Pi cotransporter family protein [Clostridia bacterium]|nr:Na/Pi cotransporter family protein [Clostridia bacterium]